MKKSRLEKPEKTKKPEQPICNGISDEIIADIISRKIDIELVLNSEQANHKEIAEKLIKAGRGGIVAKHLNSFVGLDHNEIIQKLLDDGKIGAIARHLKNFNGLEKKFAMEFIEFGLADAVALNLDSFEGLDSEVALKLLETSGELLATISTNIDKFSGLDYQQIILKLIESRKKRRL